MRRAPPLRTVALLAVLIAALPAARAQTGPDVSAAQWQQHLGRALPLQLRFADEHGQPAPLAHYFGQRPVVVLLMYLSCSQLCPLTMRLMQQAFEQAGLTPGRDFELLAVSIDPYDSPAQAARRKQQWATTAAWRRGLHILTAPLATAATRDASARLATAAGFSYVYDARSNQYGHPAGWLLADPQGRINRYFFGVRADPAALRQAVRNAAAQGPPTWSQPLRLLCYCLVSLTGRYDSVVLDSLRAACLGMLLVGAWLLWRGLRPRARLGSP